MILQSEASVCLETRCQRTNKNGATHVNQNIEQQISQRPIFEVVEGETQSDQRKVIGGRLELHLSRDKRVVCTRERNRINQSPWNCLLTGDHGHRCNSIFISREFVYWLAVDPALCGLNCSANRNKP